MIVMWCGRGANNHIMTMAIILQYTNLLNQHVVHLNSHDVICQIYFNKNNNEINLKSKNEDKKKRMVMRKGRLGDKEWEVSKGKAGMRMLCRERRDLVGKGESTGKEQEGPKWCGGDGDRQLGVGF